MESSVAPPRSPVEIRAAESFWSAVAETPGGVVDTALNKAGRLCHFPPLKRCSHRPVEACRKAVAKRSGQSGVALRFPPHSRSFAPLQAQGHKGPRAWSRTLVQTQNP